MLERGERDENPLVGKGGHSPLQTFGGSRRGLANARMHFAQLFASWYGSEVDVFGDGGRAFFF